MSKKKAGIRVILNGNASSGKDVKGIMKKIIVKGVLIFILVFLMGNMNACVNNGPIQNQNENANQAEIIEIQNGNKVAIINSENELIPIKIKIAKTQEEKEIGLMWVKKMDKNEGMIFVYDEDVQYAFWMKNTFIPLDLIFINSYGQILEILKADPCKQEPCLVYAPKNKYRYVLEMNQNFTEINKIVVGNSLKVE